MSPAMREMIGGIQPRGFRENGITVVNKTFEASLEVLVDEIRRDKTGQVNMRINELADRATEHWAKLLTTLIENGNGSSSGLCYDGQYFFDDDHSEGASGAQKNILTASEVATLNVGTAASPTPAEMQLCILDAIAYMMGYLDDQGEPMNAEAREFLVLCPKGKIFASALTAVTQPVISSSTNPLMNTGFKITAACNPRSTWTTDFALFRTDAETRAFIRQEEVPTKMEAIAEGSEEEIKNGRHIYVAKAVRNVGFGLWQRAARCTLS